MAANFLIRQTPLGWELTVESARKGLVHCEDRDVAVNIGTAAAKRRGVALIVQEEHGGCDTPRGFAQSLAA
ncbi:transposase [Cupriavidus necator]|uniref:transposase n=1 Tax=Cupriavidus necator TaxID=106590 RepID=UPI0005B3559C|nr:transposase [Cupriavidus necator]